MFNFNRIAHATRVGLAAYRSYDNMAPGALSSTWDDFGSAMRRYELYAAYYDNTIYDQLKYKLRWYRMNNNQLYRFTRGLRNPVARCVDLYPALIAGGEIDWEALKTGAIRVYGADDALIDAILQVLKWSNWGVEKSTYIRQSALLGDTILKAVDDPAKGRVWLEPVDPRKMTYFETDERGNLTYAEFEYVKTERISPTQTRDYWYKEVIDQEYFYTYKDGQPFAFSVDRYGQKLEQWPNPYGFVPVRFVRHKKIGDHERGVNCFHHVLGKIDECNDGASILHDYMRRSANPPWLIMGAKRKEDLDVKADLRDQERFIYAPAEASAQSLVHDFAVESGVALMQTDMQELRDDMPELALSELRQGVNVTQPGVEAGWSDAEARITESAGNLNDGLIGGIQMAITMAAMGNYHEAFRPYDVTSYDKGDLGFYIRAPKIIQDKLSIEQQIQYWLQLGHKRKAEELLGASQAEMDEWEREDQALQDQYMASLEAEAGGGQFGAENAS